MKTWQSLSSDRAKIDSHGLFFGWNHKTVIPVAVQAAGGLCVGQVTLLHCVCVCVCGSLWTVGINKLFRVGRYRMSRESERERERERERVWVRKCQYLYLCVCVWERERENVCVHVFFARERACKCVCVCVCVRARARPHVYSQALTSDASPPRISKHVRTNASSIVPMSEWERDLAMHSAHMILEWCFLTQVTKYAGGVKKGFAVVLGILLSTLLQVCTYNKSWTSYYFVHAFEYTASVV